MKKAITTSILFLFFLGLSATHIVGGYISYRYISGLDYEVKLTIYRDCGSQTPFDGTPNSQPPAAYVSLFNTNSNLYLSTFELYNPIITPIQSPIDNPCLQITTNVCVEQGVYTFIITVPSATESYTLVHQRCCRNGTITNVDFPGEQGATYSAVIPPTSTFQNSSPTFNSLPPTFICVNAPLILNSSASDIDGDVLTYSLCTPFNGGSVAEPAPNIPSQPPYNEIPWSQGYSLTNLLGGTPALAIDNVTGVITGTPNTIGQFVVGVCVSEFRNGQLIGTYLRDFQFNVTQCNIPVVNIPSTAINPLTGIGIYTIQCKNLTVTFQNNTYNPPPTNVPLNYEWDFGVPGISSDVSTAQFPTYTYPDTGTYLVRLVAVKGSGASACTDTTYAFVKTYPTFTTDFTSTNICQDSAASFFDQTISTQAAINLWQWDFGDGTTGTQNNPTHQYSAPGTYNVSLTGGNALGCRDLVQKTIVIHALPISNFTNSPVCVNQPVSFTNTATGAASTTFWTFGNGNTSNQTNATNTYNNVGTFAVTLLQTTANGCKDAETKQLTVNPTPNVNNNDTAICPGQSVQFQASGGATYTWSPPAGLSDTSIANPIATPLFSTSYTIVAVNQFQCSATDVVNVTILPSPLVIASMDTSVCLSGANFRDSVQLGVSGAVTYRWTPTNTLNSATAVNPIARPTANTTYYVTGTDINGCRNNDSVVVYVLDPNLNIVIDDTKNVCIYDTVYANVINQGASNYVWTPNQFLLNPDSYSPGFYPTTNTTYTLTVSNYCYSKSDAIDIVVLPLPTLTLSHRDSICIYDSTQITVSGAQSYVWDTDSALSNFNSSTVYAAPLISTYFYVTATDLNGCVNRDSTYLAIVPLPQVFAGNDTLIYRDTYALLEGVTDASIFYWTPTNFIADAKLLQTTAEPPKTQQYILFAQSEFGCSNYDTILIIVEINTILLLPTAFSPNGDGVNDVFRIVRYLNINKIKAFSVFNRWGERIFTTTDINEGWNGKYKNVEQELSTYVWQVIAQTKDLEDVVRSGNVTLVR